MTMETTSTVSVPVANAPRVALRWWQHVPMWMLSPALLLLLWEILARVGYIEVRFFPAPSTILAKLWELLFTREFWVDLGTSLRRMIVGFFMGAIPGLALGLAMGLFRPVREIFQPLVAALYPLPKIALLPLLLLVFGIGELSKYMTVAIGVFFLMTINTFAGVMNIPKIYFDVARNLKASRWKIYLTVALPGALPGIFTGMRLCMGVALLLLVAAEFVGAEEGIGYRIWWAWSVFWVSHMYVGFAVIAVLGFLSAYFVDYLERKFLPWQRR
jgi:ABC-type nitrate/sulfonate/bicarbonate transport system permease component